MNTVLDNKVIAYHAEFSKMLGNVNAGLFLSQLVYWQGKGHNQEGWIYKTQQEWYDETGLSRRGQETARKVLKDAGIIKEKLAGIPAKLHFWLDITKLKEMLKAFKKTVKPLKSQRSTKLVCPNSTSKIDQKGQTITKNTTQITFVVEEDNNIENNTNMDKPSHTLDLKQETILEPVSPVLVEKVAVGIQKHIGVSIPEWSVRSLLQCGDWSWPYIEEKIKELSGCKIKKSVTGLLRYALENNLKAIAPKQTVRKKASKPQKEAGNCYAAPMTERKKQLIQSMYMS